MDVLIVSVKEVKLILKNVKLACDEIFFSQTSFSICITKYTSGVYYSALYLVQIQRIKCILIVTFMMFVNVLAEE